MGGVALHGQELCPALLPPPLPFLPRYLVCGRYRSIPHMHLRLCARIILLLSTIQMPVSCAKELILFSTI